MTKYRLNLLALVVLLAVVSLSFARADKEGTSGSAVAVTQTSHVMVTPAQVKWGAAPPSLPAGAQVAVLDGDPSQAGKAFTMRAKFPNGYRVPPHWHPTDENVVVIKGAMMLGLGEHFDQATAKVMPAGSYMLMPQGVRHFAQAKGETIIQIYGTGPFEINYVNPADDPRNKSGK
jgi:quercetin dioxygenase-like cupin family protein